MEGVAIRCFGTKDKGGSSALPGASKVAFRQHFGVHALETEITLGKLFVPITNAGCNHEIF